MLALVTAVLITKKRIVLLPLSPPAVVLQPGLTSSSFSSRCRCQSPPRWGSGREKKPPLLPHTRQCRFWKAEAALLLAGNCFTAHRDVCPEVSTEASGSKISFHFLSHCSSRRGVPRSETSRGRSETNCCGACLLFQKNPR